MNKIKIKEILIMKLFLEKEEVKKIIQFYENAESNDKNKDTLEYLKSELEALK
jgi:hypothetical protein